MLSQTCSFLYTYGFKLDIHVSVHPSVHISFPDDNLSKYQCFHAMVYALILWRSGFGLLMGKFRRFLTALSAHHTSLFSFPDNNLCKYQWICIKLLTCIDILKTWFGIAYGHISSVLTELSARNTKVVGYYRFTFLF